VIRPDLRSTVRAVAVVSLSLPLLIAVALLGGCPFTDWYAPRMPPRSFTAAPLGDVIAEIERNGVIPVGTTWEADPLKSRKVTLTPLLFPTDREVVREIALSAGVIIGYPMGQEGQILGPLHVRAAAGAKPGVEYRRNATRSLPAPNTSLHRTPAAAVAGEL
jgi:hypothetical protein